MIKEDVTLDSLVTDTIVTKVTEIVIATTITGILDRSTMLEDISMHTCTVAVQN